MEKEKIISCIGDSLTEGDYGVFGKTGIANVHEENYPYFLEKLTGCKVLNFGHCGYRSVDILSTFENKETDVTNSDIIIIMLGTNGGQTPEGNSENDIAYNKIIDKCQELAPQAHIFLVTPPHCTVNPKFSNCGYRGNVDSASSFVRMIAEKRNISLIDLNKNASFNDDNEEIMQPNDGLHFGKIGYECLAHIIYDAIKHCL